MQGIRSHRGFTIVELIVAVTIVTIIGASVIGFAIEQSRIYAAINARTLLAADVQQQLQVISDDIRNSNAVASYNVNPDDNAPQSLLFPDTIGPANQKQYWRSASGQLVLERTSTDALNQPIAGAMKDYIVYYVRENSLYRRIIPAPYSNNKEILVNCAASYSAGGCASDRLLSSNLSNGANDFQLKYFKSDGSEVSAAAPSAIKSVSIKLGAETKRVGQSIRVSDSTLIGFRSITIEAEAAENLSVAGSAVAGPGGIYMQADIFSGTRPTYVYKGDVSTSGDLVMVNSQIGETTTPVKVNIDNNGCVSGTTFVPCTSAPISMSNGSTIYANVCARLQTSSSNISNLLPSNCIRPPLALPSFNRSAFINSMTAGTVSNSAGTYNCVNGGTRTLPANTIIDGSVSVGGGGCTTIIGGNVYIKGDFTINSSSNIRAADSSDPAITVVVTGRISAGNTTNVYRSTNGTKINLVSLYSVDAACTASTTCTVGDLPANTIYDTLQTTEAIGLNGAKGGGIGIVYALFGKARLNYSSVVEQISGQRIELMNKSTVTGPT